MHTGFRGRGNEVEIQLLSPWILESKLNPGSDFKPQQKDDLETAYYQIKNHPFFSVKFIVVDGMKGEKKTKNNFSCGGGGLVSVLCR